MLYCSDKYSTQEPENAQRLEGVTSFRIFSCSSKNLKEVCLLRIIKCRLSQSKLSLTTRICQKHQCSNEVMLIALQPC